MKSTIEKALQRQQEKQQQASASASEESSKEQSTIEKGVELKAKAQSENVEVSTPAPSVKADSKQAADSKGKGKDNQNHFEIDLQRLDDLGFINIESGRNVISEQYREIKRKLLQNAFGPLASTISSSNIIMVSSARPSEGKTFTAVNLALSIAAEQDKTVLLVDADVLKPNVLRTLGLDGQIGLMEYLLGQVDDLSDVIFHTNVPKLRIIPAGGSHHLSTELLASSVMRDTVEEFSNRYPDRVVIIDTPPLIGINESAVLANLAGQAIVVVEEGRSKLGDIQSAVERLNPDMAIGFVVNKSTKMTEKYGYYGYQYYGSDEEKD